MREGGMMKDDELDRVVSEQDEIQPSSGFAASVMEAVRREAAAPPPIPFPWKRALPGLVVGAFALALVLVAGVVAIAHSVHAPTNAQFSISWTHLLPSVFQPNLEAAAIWTVLVLLVSLLSVKLSMRLAAGRA